MPITVFDIIFAVILTEAIVNLIFYGGILQPLREWIIRHIPLRVRGEHLLDCSICTSFWVGILCVILVKYTTGNIIMQVFLWGVVIHRLSNYLHLGYSLIRDQQLDIRVKRRKRNV